MSLHHFSSVERRLRQLASIGVVCITTDGRIWSVSVERGGIEVTRHEDRVLEDTLTRCYQWAVSEGSINEETS